MLRACERLMLTFDCSVLLVHHTGVAKDAGQRARGSSAWRAALDIEVSVTVDDLGNRKIEMMKSKDTELAEPRGMTLEQVEIIGATEEGDDGLPAPVTSAVVALCNLVVKVETVKLSAGAEKMLRAFDSVVEKEGAGVSAKALREAYKEVFQADYEGKPNAENNLRSAASKAFKAATEGDDVVLREFDGYWYKV